MSQTRHKVLITTVPFGKIDSKPLDMLRQAEGVETIINPIGRRLTSPELTELIRDVSVLIAGTEPILRESLEAAEKLKIICRVGIGLDNVDLATARKLGVKVTYTPDAPAPAVAELTIAHMLNLCRSLGHADRELRRGVWSRPMGSRLATSIIGIIGAGRIGKLVIRHLSGFEPSRVLVNEIIDIGDLCAEFGCIDATKDEIFEEADIISLHVPLSSLTRNMVGREQFEKMKPTALLINTARGGIVDEDELFRALDRGDIAGAAVDVFEQEPYDGRLLQLDNCALSCHMGSCTEDCRFAMELQAVEDALRFINGEPLKDAVPEEEYQEHL